MTAKPPAAHRALALLASVLVIAGASGPARAQTKTPFDLDVLISLTGPGAFGGETTERSLNLLEADVNAHGGIHGRPLHFAYHDDGTSPALALQQLNAIAVRHPAVVLGPVYSALCNAVAPVIATAGPVVFCISPAVYPPKGSFMFSAGPSQADLIRVLIRYYHNRGLTRIASITSTDAAGQDADKAIAEYFKTDGPSGPSLVDTEHFNPTDIDVSAQVSRIKAARADALLLWTSGAPVGTVLRAVQQLGLDVPIGIAPSNMNYPTMRQYATILPRELYFPGVADVVNEAASRDSRNALNRYVSLLTIAGVGRDMQTGTAWDPASILIDALRHVGTGATAQQVRDYILSLNGYGGISGIYNFTDGRQRGLTESTLLVMRWEPAKNAWTPVTKFGGALRK